MSLQGSGPETTSEAGNGLPVKVLPRLLRLWPIHRRLLLLIANSVTISNVCFIAVYVFQLSKGHEGSSVKLWPQGTASLETISSGEVNAV